MQEITAYLLGEPHILLGGEPIVFPFKQVQALLFYLLVEGQTPRMKLTDLIWGDSGEQKAKSSMRNAMYVLRKAIGNDLLQEDPQNRIGLHPGCRIRVDLAQFMESQELPEKGYPGDFLEGFYLKGNENFTEWQSDIQRRYNRTYLDCLKREISQSFAQKRWDHCEASCLQLLELDEYDESVYQCLMEIYRACGKYSKAAALYTRLQKLFSEELFQAPSEETSLLARQIKTLRSRQASRLIAQEPPASPPPDDRVLFGRETEEAFLLQTLRSFAKGYAGISAAVFGESGIGKTYLVENILGRFEKEMEIQCFCTRCYRAEERFAFKPWQAVFDQLITFFHQQYPLEHSEAFVRAISNVFPLFSPDPSTAIEQNEGLSLQYGAPERVIAHSLIQMAQKQPLILFFDDLQWADNPTVSLIQNIVTLNQNKNILFLLTYKHEKSSFTHSFLENMSLARLVKKVGLHRFTFDETIRLAECFLPGGFDSDEMKQSFYRETDGNPFYIVETASSLKHHAPMTDITPNIRDRIGSRIMQLPPECRSILNLLSIFFDGASFELLSELSGWEEGELIETLESLIHQQLIQEAAQPSGGIFQFNHQKILEYVYGEMSATKQRILHNKAAGCLEKKLRHNDSDFQVYPKLMYHFQCAKNQKKYLEYYIEYVYSYSNRTHEYYPVIFDLGAGSNESPLDISNSTDEKIQQVLNELEELVEQNAHTFSDEDLCGFFSDYLHMMGRFHIRQSSYQKGLSYIHQLIRINQGQQSKRCCANIVKGNRQLGCVYLNRYETDKVRAVIDETLSTLRNIYRIEEAAVWMRFSGLCHIMSGNIPAAIRDLEYAVSVFENSAQKNQYLYNLAASYAWLGEVERSQMRYSRAIEYYDHAISICQGSFPTGGTATFYTYAGQAALDSGDLVQAEKYLSLAVKQFHSIELMWERGIAFGYYGMLCIKQRKYQPALEYFKIAAQSARRLESPYEQGVLQRMYAQIALEMRSNPELHAVFCSYLDQGFESYAHRAGELLKDIYSPIDRLYLEQLAGSSGRH